MAGKQETEKLRIDKFRVARHPPTIGALPVTVLDGAHKFRSALITV